MQLYHINEKRNLLKFDATSLLENNLESAKASLNRWRMGETLEVQFKDANEDPLNSSEISRIETLQRLLKVS